MKLNKKLIELCQLGIEANHILYNICFRPAGIGIMWSDPSKLEGQPQTAHNYKKTLYIDKYYSTIVDAVEYEIKRLKEIVI